MGREEFASLVDQEEAPVADDTFRGQDDALGMFERRPLEGGHVDAGQHGHSRKVPDAVSTHGAACPIIRNPCSRPTGG